jgi:hypothetical protein
MKQRDIGRLPKSCEQQRRRHNRENILLSPGEVDAHL